MNFERAKLQSTAFRQMELYGASFRHAVLLRTTFAGYGTGTASLIKVIFSEAVLVEVDLRDANLYNADLKRALLIRCDLRGANLAGADLTGARLIDCRTEGADLTDATV
jgi:uncharacterized protein YjbI with pentapeptide repeats